MSEQATREDFLAALLATFAALGKPEPKTAALQMWLAVLQHEKIDFSQAIAALREHCCREPYQPTPAHIVAILKGTKKEQQMQEESEAARAWGTAIEAVQRVGSTSCVVFDDWRIHVAIQACGGWLHLCQSKYDDLPATQAIFRRAFANAQPGTHKPIMPGRFSAPPKLLGDPEKCKNVMASGKQRPLAEKIAEGKQI